MVKPKRKLKLQHKQQESIPESSKDATPDDLEENVPSLPSCSSQCSDTIKGPGEVISHYNQVLKTFKKVRTMSEAFHRHNVDRGTIAATAPIAELQIAAPKTYSTLVFNPAMETLFAFAKRCASSVNPEIKRSIEDLKARGHLLPILMKY
ncbi:hypothetical protein QQF64_009539 [Cirrhinus molitorella]|uniref:Coiled-coil domain-containing protein 106-like n=1 Tax=Cirrhinus molitorella TaxID=172907 RepID=A0ABR3M1F8_9TELE